MATSCIGAAGFSVLGLVGCAGEASEDSESTADELRSHASEASIHEWSAEARGILAVVNDRWLGSDDYVYRVRISRVAAEAILAVRNGTNGINESRPMGWSGPGASSSGGPIPPFASDGANPSPYPYPYPYSCGWGGSSGWSASGGSSGWGGSSDAGAPSAPTDPWSGSSGGTSGSTHPMPPPPYSCHVSWQLGGDDESFTRVSEVDALPGTDVSAFSNLRDFAYRNGYVQPSMTDAGPPVHVDGGPHPHFDAGPPVHVDAGHH